MPASSVHHTRQRLAARVLIAVTAMGLAFTMAVGAARSGANPVEQQAKLYGRVDKNL